MRVDLLIKNAAQIATPVTRVPHALPGNNNFMVIENGSVAIRDGVIAAIGETPEVISSLNGEMPRAVIDASNKVILPGFVDCHTHPVFFHTRENEFTMRLMGKSYRQIAETGGGIRSSVRSIRSASKEQIIEAVLPRLDRFVEHGTTTIEAKSGYGLSTDDEIKSLECIQELDTIHPLDLIPTFLGAHEIPDEYRTQRNAYIDLIINDMIPRVAERALAEFCDIYIEQHVFTIDEGRKILTAAKSAGLHLKVHANQLSANGGAALAAEVGAISAEHLDYISPEEIEQLARGNVVPVLLPGAVFYLNSNHYAPAREMLEAKLPVAISTDFNPGSCMTESMPIIMTISCIKMRLLPAEAITAATLNAARAVNRQNTIGSLEIGKQADLVIWDMPAFEHIVYHFGVNLADTVIKKGKIIWQKQRNPVLKLYRKKLKESLQ